MQQSASGRGDPVSEWLARGLLVQCSQWHEAAAATRRDDHVEASATRRTSTSGAGKPGMALARCSERITDRCGALTCEGSAAISHLLSPFPLRCGYREGAELGCRLGRQRRWGSPRVSTAACAGRCRSVQAWQDKHCRCSTLLKRIIGGARRAGRCSYISVQYRRWRRVATDSRKRSGQEHPMVREPTRVSRPKAAGTGSWPWAPGRNLRRCSCEHGSALPAAARGRWHNGSHLTATDTTECPRCDYRREMRPRVGRQAWGSLVRARCMRSTGPWAGIRGGEGDGRRHVHTQ